ncbi:hypothetical protein GMRT_22958 [Giardia muris]|uniref:Uncharacterized protein n=1 Tax=Giardia muris TaxID=5742 RepID=A0A4Z1SQZ9_GIAMU|nr:hypothetical protein GMRT_22958 [Giardia muris]|eukprot:TNJ27385.1 hypothetical protein GMRT_22958 [Giardia muris]
MEQARRSSSHWAHSNEEQTFRQGMLLAVCVGTKEHHSDRSVWPLAPDSSQGSRECTGKEDESSPLSREASLRSHSFVVEDHPVGPPASCPTGQGGQMAVLRDVPEAAAREEGLLGGLEVMTGSVLLYSHWRRGPGLGEMGRSMLDAQKCSPLN